MSSYYPFEVPMDNTTPMEFKSTLVSVTTLTYTT